MEKFKFKASMFVDNVLGICPECKEEAFLVIKYMKLKESDKEYIKAHGKKS